MAFTLYAGLKKIKRGLFYDTWKLNKMCLPMHLSKVLLEHGQTCVCIVCGCFQAALAGLTSCDRL